MTQLKDLTLHTVGNILEDLKCSAYQSARLPLPYEPHKWEIRSQFGKPFRCMHYNSTVRRINALEDMIKFCKHHLGK